MNAFERAVARDPGLTADGRKALLAVYDVLVTGDDGWSQITAVRVTEMARIVVRRRSQLRPVPGGSPLT